MTMKSNKPAIAAILALACTSLSSWAAQSFDFLYRIRGSSEVAPVQAFDDGQRTYFQYGRNGRPGDFYAVTPKGEVRLKTRDVGGYLAVDGVHRHFIIRTGDEVATVNYLVANSVVTPKTVEDQLAHTPIADSASNLVILDVGAVSPETSVPAVKTSVVVSSAAQPAAIATPIPLDESFAPTPLPSMKVTGAIAANPIARDRASRPPESDAFRPVISGERMSPSELSALAAYVQKSGYDSHYVIESIDTRSHQVKALVRALNRLGINLIEIIKGQGSLVLRVNK